MSTHAKLSPSARHRWGKCPASVREEAKYPPEPSGPAAIDGTHSHTLLEKCIIDELVSASTLIGQTLKDHEGEFVVDADRAERVDFALAYIDGRLDEYHMAGGATVLAERLVNPSHLLKRDDMPGTVDVQIISADVLEIIDYKDGMNIVPAEDNPQLEQYAIAVLSEHVFNAIPLPKRVKMTIIQPKLRVKGMDGIVSWEINTSDLLGRVNRMFMEAAATDDPNAPFNPGEEQCKYCRHKACVARTEHVLKASGISFSPVDVAHQSAGKDPAAMTDAQLRELIEAAPLLRQMIEAAETEAMRRMEAGGTIPGLKLVRGRGSRAWAFPDDQMEEKLKKFGIPKSEIWETKLLSPTKVEKLAWTKKDGSKYQLTDRQLQTMRAEYITSKEGSLTVVPESDDRKAVTISAAGMFAPVNTEPSLPSFLLPLGA